MKRKIKQVLLLAAGCTAGASWGADLVSVYRDALAYDAPFASARATLEAARERVPQARAGLLPAVALAAATTWNDVESNIRSEPPASVPLKYNSNGWTASLTQPLFRWQNWVGFNQSQWQVTQGEAQFLGARLDLMVRVAGAYFDMLLAQEALITANTQKAAIAEQLEAAKRNFEVGTATITDTYEAQSRHDLAVAQEIAAGNDVSVRREALRTLTGKDQVPLKGLRAGMRIGAPQPNDIAPWANLAEASNPAVQAARAGLEIATQEVERQRAGHYPTLDLVATRGRASQGNSLVAGRVSPGADNDATTIGVQLSVPLFAGGAIDSRSREAAALRERAAADLDNARRSANLQARQAYLGVTAGLSQINAFEAALASSQLAVEANKLGYDVGVRINIDVLNAQSQLYDTRQRLAKARFDTLIAQLRLKAAAGNLSEDDLVAINALLE